MYEFTKGKKIQRFIKENSLKEAQARDIHSFKCYGIGHYDVECPNKNKQCKQKTNNLKVRVIFILHLVKKKL